MVALYCVSFTQTVTLPSVTPGMLTVIVVTFPNSVGVVMSTDIVAFLSFETVAFTGMSLELNV